MLLRYRPIDHVSHIIGQARAPPATRLFYKSVGPLVICSNRTAGPSGRGEADKDRREDGGWVGGGRRASLGLIFFFLTDCWRNY